MIINTAGDYTLQYTATDACGNTTVVERELTVEAPLIYGILSKYDNSPVCERIGRSALFSDPSPQYSDGNGGWIGGSSPFDNILPWSGMEVVEDAEAGKLVKIPKYYYKWTRNVDELQLEISPIAQPGFLVSPAHADRGDGAGERDYAYVGRYFCSDTDYKSTSGVLPKGSTKRSEFRTAISALGNDVWQFDFAMYWTIAMLYLVEFANWNSQAMIGGGCSDNQTMENTGLTDGMTYHTGTTNTQVGETDYGHIQYRHIEDLWANMKCWCDGIYFSSNNVYCIKNPSDFGESNGTLVGPSWTSVGYPTTFLDPSLVNGFEYALFPSGGTTSIGSSRVPDRYYHANNSPTLFVGCGSPNHTTDTGLFCMSKSDLYSSGYSGSRVQKLPSA